jgi:hypothetical protein
MAAIFSHITPGGEQCYYAAAQYTNINFRVSLSIGTSFVHLNFIKLEWHLF